MQLDINIWRLDSSKKKILLDFGFKVFNTSAVKNIFIYFPFKITKDMVSDLGCKLENISILKGIFNENYSIQQDNKNIIVKDQDNNEQFSIYKFDIQENINIKDEYNGSVLSFSVKDYGTKKVRYYRFRLSLNECFPLINYYRPKNSFFESAFIETEVLDFRINEQRNQNEELLEKISENKRFVIEGINLFVMSPIKDELIADGINFEYKRQLEGNNFWAEYLNTNYGEMSVYKCNKASGKSKKFEDFNCFCKINYRKSNFLTILKYLGVLLVVTVVFSIVSNLLSELINKSIGI